MAPHIWIFSLGLFIVDLVIDVLNRQSDGDGIFSEVWNDACFLLLNDLQVILSVIVEHRQFQVCAAVDWQGYLVGLLLMNQL